MLSNTLEKIFIYVFPFPQPQAQQLQRASSSGGSQYGTGMQMANPNSTYGSIGNVSNNSGAAPSAGPGPAPTTKPPTPPQASRYSSGTLNRYHMFSLLDFLFLI